MAEQEQKFFNIPIPNKLVNASPEQRNESILNVLRSIYDAGGPTVPVISKRPISAISSNTGLKRLNRIQPLSDSPLAYSNLVDAIFGTGTLSSLGDVSNVSTSGLPFAAYGAKGINKLFHGTPKGKKLVKFNPELYNKSDVLGHMTHAAERPEYANTYAEKMGFPVGWADDPSPAILPLKPEATNVLDLVDPNPDDIAQAMAFAENKEELVGMFKRGKRWIREAKEKNDPLIPPERELLFRHSAHSSAPLAEHPIRKVAEDIKLSPETTENMPWDAIRYHDVDERSWAFPRRTPIKSIFGAPLTEEEAISPIRMFRQDELSTGNFPVPLSRDAKLTAKGGIFEGGTPMKSIYNKPNPPEDYEDYFKGFYKPLDLTTQKYPITQNYTTKDKTKFGDYKMGDVFTIINKNDNKSTKIEIFNEADIEALEELKGYDNYIITKDKDYSTKPIFKFDKEPKTHTIPSEYDWNSNQYLLKIGTKKFPQTKTGLALAKQYIKVMSNDSVISGKEAENLYKALNKYKPIGGK